MHLTYSRWANSAALSSAHPISAFHRIAVLWLAIAISSLSQNSLAQTSPPPLPSDPFPTQPKTATVSLGVGQIVSPQRHKVTFEKVGLQPAQAVIVTLQYPPALAGRTVAVEPLDGGRVITPAENLIVGLNGAFTFQYQAGAKPGLYQVRLHYDTQAIALQFWVFDNAHLENGPPVLIAP